MAKISAHGAREVARYRSPDGRRIWVVTDDGRVLSRVIGWGCKFRIEARCGDGESGREYVCNMHPDVEEVQDD